MDNLSGKAQQLKPTVWIGKKGIDEYILTEIRKQLKTKQMVKIKVLGNVFDEINVDKKKLPFEIAKAVEAQVVHKIGFTFTLYKGKEE